MGKYIPVPKGVDGSTVWDVYKYTVRARAGEQMGRKELV